MKKETVIKMIDTFFDELNWNRDFQEDTSVFLSGVSMENILGDIQLIIGIHENAYTVYAILSSRVEGSYLADVAEYLHRVNYGMNIGNFELNYQDGRVRYKVHVEFTECALSQCVINDSIWTPLAMFDQYGKNLIKIMLGEGVPSELAKAAESNEHSEESQLT